MYSELLLTSLFFAFFVHPKGNLPQKQRISVNAIKNNKKQSVDYISIVGTSNFV